jgi:phosphohistidine phosphatase
MKTLHLLRHAKSSWDDLSLEDHDRPLNKRGRRTAEAIAAQFPSDAQELDLVLGSTARRVRETLEPILLVYKPKRIVLERKLYQARPPALLERLRRIDESYLTVLVVGHNPGLHELALALSDPASLDALPSISDKFPTGALATFQFAMSWRRLGPGTAKLVAYRAPRDAATAPQASKAG